MERFSKYLTLSGGTILKVGSVSVKYAGTNTPALVYSDAAGLTPLAASFPIDGTTGEAAFYAPNGIYDITITNAVGSPVVFNSTTLFDPTGLNITADWNTLINKPTTFTPSTHTHVVTDTTGLSASLALLAPLDSPVHTGTVTGDTFVAGVGGATTPSFTFAGNLNYGMHLEFATIIFARGGVGDIIGIDSGGLKAKSTSVIGWSSGAFNVSYDTMLARDGAGILGLRNGTNYQMMYIYKSYTDAANNSRLELGNGADTYVRVLASGAGSGASSCGLLIGTRNANPCAIALGNAARWQWDGGSPYTLKPLTDNAFDIGTASLQVRNLYVGTNVYVAGSQLPKVTEILMCAPFTSVTVTAAQTAILTQYYYRRFDATGYTKFRVNFGVTVSLATAVVRAQYSLDGSTGWTDLEFAAGTVGDATMGTAGALYGAWAPLATAAKADVFFRLTTINGDGTTRSMGNIVIQFATA